MHTIMGMITRLGHGLTTTVIIVCMAWANSAAASAAEGKHTIVDALGRSVTIPAKVERIACMYAFTGHIVAMLGKADHIVAVSNGLKRDILLAEMFPAIAKAVVPKIQGAINIEELTGARPDIVFIQSQTGNNPAMADKLDAVGLTWLAVDFHNMAEQRATIAMIGKAIGATQKADDYNNYYLSCIDRVHQMVADIPPESRLRVYHSTVEPNRTSPKNSLPSDWISAAGVVDVTSRDSAGLLNGNDQVAMEQILFWDPEVILANEPGVTDAIKKSPKWAPVTAVKNNRIYQLPIGISRWGHPGSLETPLAILWTAKTVYPEKFRHIDMAAEVKRFYHLFFNNDLSEKMIEQILSGKGMRLNKKRQ